MTMLLYCIDFSTKTSQKQRQGRTHLDHTVALEPIVASKLTSHTCLPNQDWTRQVFSPAQAVMYVKSKEV